MVPPTIMENGKASPPRKSSSAGIGPGNYHIVGWDMDTTGKKIIDEICQIAGYTPSSSYSQYVMPYKDLNPPAMKRHNMKVVTIGKFRVLKDNKANKVLKTKTEVSALTEFLEWLESVRGDAADGVILVYHEPRKVIPAVLIESLKRYNLLDRFKQTVKGFVNGFNVAEAKCTVKVDTFTLRTLSRVLLNQEKHLDDAKYRASLALQIIQHFSSLEATSETATNGSGDSDSAIKKTVEFIREFVQQVEVEEEEHAELKIVLERQNTLRPIFESLFRENRRERQQASPLRRSLAEAGIEYSQLQEAWNNDKRNGLEKLLKDKLTTTKEKNMENLMTILEDHFNPKKEPELNNNKTDSGTASLDTTSSSPVKVNAEPSENGAIVAEE